MARDWSLQETKTLVEEHILLKQQEKAKIHTASEHWNKVAKRLRERGFNRSHKSCNKRWYRLEQYEVQIFSFNMEQGKHRNYWDLTKAERLEYRDKWPQLPLGDGIDREIFDSLKRISQQYEKESAQTTETPVACVAEEVPPTEMNTVNVSRHLAQDPLLTVATCSTPTTLPMPMAAGPTAVAAVELKGQNEIEAQKQVKSTWLAATDQEPLSSPAALDGFKLQARELRRQRAAELRRNNRTVPYNSTHTTFTKANQSSPLSSETPPPTPEADSSVPSKVTHSHDLSYKNLQGEKSIKAGKYSNTPAKPPLHGINTTSTPILYKVDMTVPQSFNNDRQLQQRPIGSHLGFQVNNLSNQKSHQPAPQQLGESTSAEHHGIELQGTHLGHPNNGGHLPLLHSINSHLPLLQPEDSHVRHQHKTAAVPEAHHHSPLDGDNLPLELLQLGSLEEQLQVILGVQPGPLQDASTCEQKQLHMKQNLDGHLTYQSPPFRRQVPERHNHQENVQGATATLMGTAMGGLEVQLAALVRLLLTKHTIEQEFREKLLMFVECMVVSLHAMAQANARTTS